MNHFCFTPESGIDFVFVIDPETGLIREITNKMATVSNVRAINVDKPDDLAGIVIRMEDPAHPRQCWIFNSFKELEDNVPFRKYQYLPDEHGKEKLVGIGFYYQLPPGVENFIEEYRKKWVVRGRPPKNDVSNLPWTVSLEKWQIYCIEQELLDSETRYECPYGKNFGQDTE